uniref:C-type lectin domain-containing protein n=1 Tax=Cyprinus carpio TaxID=7962 RepID=A0A8C2PTS6_CYPCA
MLFILFIFDLIIGDLFYIIERDFFYLTTFVFSTGFFTVTLCAPQYIFVNESKTWAEAQRYCRDKYTDLATIENEHQTLQLMDTVNDYSTDLAWIGLYDDLNIWKWTLEDSDFFKVEEKNFRNWYNQGPGNSGAQSLCVYINSGIWYAASCSTFEVADNITAVCFK